METKVKEIILKIENGGSTLNHKDIDHLVARLKRGIAVINRIAIVSNACNQDKSSLAVTLDTIKILTNDFIAEGVVDER